MLRGFARHFNSTVFRGPDTEGAGGGGDADTDLEVGGVDEGGSEGGAEGTEGEGGEAPQEPLSMRDQIKKAMAESSEPAQPKAKKEPKGRAAAAPKDGAPAAPKDGTAAAAPAAGEVPMPESLPATLKAEWDKAPQPIKDAFIKREQDMARGVNELKQRYTLIDQAIAPHTDALRQMNATPGEAVNRMFLWFKALAGKPEEAFPALAQNMGFNWQQLTAPKASGADPAHSQSQAQPGAAPEIPEPVRNYVGQLEKQVRDLTGMVQQIHGGFSGIQQDLNTQNEARTRENLSIWSKDKDYFEEVRVDMAKLIETGLIPLKPDGQVDLDTAYERAIHFNPTVRAKVLAAQQQANQQVQQDAEKAATTAQQTQVTKARRASVSLPASTTPGAGNGAPVAPRGQKPGQKLSVRESLKQSIAQLRDQ